MIGAYGVEEAALLFCFVALSAIILFFMVPDRFGVARSEPPKPPRTLSRPHWAERPAAEAPATFQVEAGQAEAGQNEAPLPVAA